MMKKIKKIKKLRVLKTLKFAGRKESIENSQKNEEKPIFIMNNLREDLILLSFERIECFCFYGNIRIMVLSGNVEILGYEIEPNSEFSLEISSFQDEVPLEIIARPPNSNKKTLLPKEIEGFSLDFLNNSHCNVLIKTINLENFMILEKNKIGISFIENNHKEISNKIIRKLNEFPNDYNIRKILLFGDKSSGKALSSYYLLNSLLKTNKKAGFLELDLNNPIELPGTITYYSIKEAILSNKPDFHRVSLEKQRRFIGERLCNRNIELFYRSIEDLLEKIRGDNSILVIRTQGYLKGLGELILLDVIRLVKPFFMISCGENACFQALQEKNERKMSLLTEKKGGLLENYETFMIDKPKFDKNIKKIKKDMKIYEYFKDSKLKEEKLRDFLAMPDIKRPCYLNLLRFSKTFSLNFAKKKVFLLNEGKLMNLSEVPVINSLEFSIVGLFPLENHIISQEIHQRNCLGLGFIKSINTEKQEFEIILPGELENYLEKIELIVKSPDFGFSREFFTGFYQESLVYGEVLEDFQGKNEEVMPFVSESFNGVIGDKPYIQRISGKRHNK